MARILAIDYGLKRVGLAVTDPMQIIATALETVPRHELLDYLKKYCQAEEVETFVLGFPTQLDGSDTDATEPVRKFAETLQKTFPDIRLHLHDERFSSKIALDAMIRGGTKKKYRQNKANIDKVSAVVILQSYLESKAGGNSPV